MATPKQNYARQYQAYAQSIEPDIPASVRTYSIFNPDTGTWQRITNNFRSPIPVQGQTAVPVQVPVQTSPRTSRRRSPAAVPAGQPQSAPQKTSKRGFDIAPLGDTESVKLTLAPRPVDRFRATVSPDYHEPVYLPLPPAPASAPAPSPNEPVIEYGPKYGLNMLNRISPIRAYIGGFLKSLF